MTLRRLVVVIAVVEVVLAAAGSLTDRAALRGSGAFALIGVALAQALCVLLVTPFSTRSATIRIGAGIGLVAGGMYGAEVVAEYLSPTVTDASVVIGWIIVIGLVAAAVLASAAASLRERSLRAGITAAVYAMVFEYLTWYPVVLLSYYAFRTSPATDRVWRAEGTYDDFARSGMTDIRAFVIQDFWGAGTFHLLAGLVIAAVFGTIAATLPLLLPKPAPGG
ncbi:hypothetical protein [Kribbella jiaozuonensis]|uniref:Uncharacterized protein n=1 Tax=Kribbella jiaozuonensis TaxID=2575441 RepID=A0A4U3LKF3_9ACTN|nr:hypothetical protein [Kribbella jiaozuonensis]TKK76111.1 hypothetical protein FDA38_27215 [Kribbella jiaozuonensis]